MQVGTKVDETGMLLREGDSFVLRRDAGGRLLLDLRRTPVAEANKHVRVTGTWVGDSLIDVDKLQLL